MAYNSKFTGAQIDDLLDKSKTMGATVDKLAQDVAAKEDAANKVTTLDASATDEQYPSAKAVMDELDELESKVQDVELDVDGEVICDVTLVKGSLVNKGYSYGKRMTNYIPVRKGDVVTFVNNRQTPNIYHYGYQGYTEAKVLNPNANRSPFQLEELNTISITRDDVRFVRFEFTEVDESGNSFPIGDEVMDSSMFKVLVKRNSIAEDVESIKNKVDNLNGEVIALKGTIINNKCNLFWINAPLYNTGWEIYEDRAVYPASSAGSKDLEYPVFKNGKAPRYIYVLTEGTDFGQLAYYFVYKNINGGTIGVTARKYLSVGATAKIIVPTDMPSCDYVVFAVSGSLATADTSRKITLRNIVGADTEESAIPVASILETKNEITTIFLKGEIINSETFPYHVSEGDLLDVTYSVAEYSAPIDVHQSFGVVNNGGDWIKITTAGQEKTIKKVITNDSEKVWVWGRTSYGSILKITRYTRGNLRNKEIIMTDVIRENNNHKRIDAPYISFIDDDGKADVYSVLNPYFCRKNIPYSIAVPTSKIGTTGYMTKEQVCELYNQGVDVLSHSHGHSSLFSSNLTDSRIESECKTPLNIFRGWGMSVKDFCFPGGQYDEVSMQIASRYYRYIYLFEQSRGEGYNTIANIRNTYIKRHSFTTFDNAKALVDSALEEKGWIIITTHVNGYGWNGEAELDSLISYVKEKGFVIERADDAAAKFCNVYEQGQKCFTSNLEVIEKE